MEKKKKLKIPKSEVSRWESQTFRVLKKGEKVPSAPEWPEPKKQK